jgi:quinoprotein glucose dehydrogenase
VNAAVLGTGSVREQQAALAVIAQQPGAEADRVLGEQLDALRAGKVPGALALDLLEAAALRADAGVKAKLAAFEQARKADDPLARWRECLEGGDAKLGREIFYEKAEAGCLRCHKVKGEGGDVGRTWRVSRRNTTARICCARSSIPARSSRPASTTCCSR